MSHASHEWVRDIVPRIRALAREMGRPIALLLDTQGPAIRSGDLKENLHLKPGDILVLTVRGARLKERYSNIVKYVGIVDDVSCGNRMLMDNGLIMIVARGKRKNRKCCKAPTRANFESMRN